MPPNSKGIEMKSCNTVKSQLPSLPTLSYPVPLFFSKNIFLLYLFLERMSARAPGGGSRGGGDGGGGAEGENLSKVPSPQ